MLHVQMLCWDIQEDGQGKISLRHAYSGKLDPQDMLFHSVDKYFVEIHAD